MLLDLDPFLEDLIIINHYEFFDLIEDRNFDPYWFKLGILSTILFDSWNPKPFNNSIVINKTDRRVVKFAKSVGLGWIHEYPHYLICDKCKDAHYIDSHELEDPELLKFANTHRKCKASVKQFSITDF